MVRGDPSPSAMPVFIAIIDAGTGLRNLGRDLRAIGHKQEQIVIALRGKSLSMGLQNTQYVSDGPWILVCAVIGRDNVLVLSPFNVRAPVGHDAVA